MDCNNTVPNNLKEPDFVQDFFGQTMLSMSGNIIFTW